MTKTRPKLTNKRKFTRFKTYDFIRLASESGKGFESNPTLVNVSEGGLCFYCTDLLRLNDRVSITIHISRFNCVVKAHARIVWTQPSTEHVGVYFTGVEFVGLNENDRDVLRRLEKANRVRR